MKAEKRLYRFVLNGEVKEVYAINFIKAVININKEYPEVKKLDYRTLNITEIK